jgi:putative protease
VPIFFYNGDMTNVELLAPAGSPEALDAAIGEGADAVYLGLKNFNARMRTSNFAYSQFEGTVKNLHRMKKKIYVTVNTVFEQREADRMYQLLRYLSIVGPDGLIVQDFGVAKMVRDHFPKLKLHASTQMNIAGMRGVNLLSKCGFSRAVLARELTLDEIRDVKQNTNMELEVFIHGALCVSASGICLFSSYLGGKSANRGMCTQACRRLYQDDEDKGYFFSPMDLQLAELIPDLAEAGVSSFKIEGRMKSAEYVGTVVSAYRRIIDGIGGGEDEKATAVQEGLQILQNDFARTKTKFYHLDGNVFDWLNPRQDGGTGISLGTILKVKGVEENRQALIQDGLVGLELGDSVRLHKADDSIRQSHKITIAEKESSRRTWISIPENFDVGDSVYLIQTKAMVKRYSPVIPRDLTGFRRVPGRDSAPHVNLPALKKHVPDRYPEGFYAQVSGIDDLYILQAVRPVRVMLNYSRKVAKRLLSAGGDYDPLPFGPKEMIIVLNPYFPQKDEALLAEEIPLLLEMGYYQFVVNNLGHLSFFKNANVHLIAGPYLYTFNRYAESFLADLGLDDIITPVENNRQNLERTIQNDRRAGVFVNIFAYPALFRIRADLGEMYDFNVFKDSRKESFSLINNQDDGSIVIPEKAFSIVDKVPFLKEAGFRRFVLDFSGPRLRKKDYKDVMTAFKNGQPLPGTTRFNWRDGFFSNEEPKGIAKLS